MSCSCVLFWVLGHAIGVGKTISLNGYGREEVERVMSKFDAVHRGRNSAKHCWDTTCRSGRNKAALVSSTYVRTR